MCSKVAICNAVYPGKYRIHARKLLQGEMGAAVSNDHTSNTLIQMLCFF